MNRGDRMLSVLRDGHWHARADIFQRVGYMLTNNSASELRARGYDVEQRIFQGNYEYRISQSSRANQGGSPTSPRGPVAGRDTAAAVTPSPAEQQLQLIAAA